MIFINISFNLIVVMICFFLFSFWFLYYLKVLFLQFCWAYVSLESCWNQILHYIYKSVSTFTLYTIHVYLYVCLCVWCFRVCVCGCVCVLCICKIQIHQADFTSFLFYTHSFLFGFGIHQLHTYIPRTRIYLYIHICMIYFKLVFKKMCYWTFAKLTDF